MTQTAEQVHAARITDRGDLFWFASLDGELWIEVSTDPRSATREQINRLMNPGAWLPMRATRGFLRRQGATFLTEGRHA